jgi:hypothetical protein
MAENYRALVTLLVLALPTLWFVRKLLTPSQVISDADFNVRATLWVVLTAVLFLVQSFWLFMLIAAAALLTYGRKDRNPLGLYVFILFLAPPFQSAIQGFAGINYFIAVDYLRLLSFVLLLPTAARLISNPTTPKPFRLPADKYVLGYLALLLAIQVPLTSMTDLGRSGLMHFIDTVLPYYVFSRGLGFDLKRLRDIAASFAAAGAILAVVAVFEYLKGWLLFSSLPNFLDVRWAYGHYMARDGGLRATVSLGHSIVLGYVLTVALGLNLMLRDAYRSARLWQLACITLGIGLLASLSRGPWVGAAALILVYVVIGPGAPRRIGQLAGILVLLLPLLTTTSVGQRLLSYLPFIGDVDAVSVTYRQLLFDVSWTVLMQNPILGSPYYFANTSMEQLRQGEGIIDMVNSYLGVAMVSGFVGLALFIAPFLSCLVGLARHLFNHPTKQGDDYSAGKALLASLVSVLIIIATTSSINVVPVVYWCLVGICASYLHAARLRAAGTLPHRQAGPERLRMASTVSS